MILVIIVVATPTVRAQTDRSNPSEVIFASEIDLISLDTGSYGKNIHSDTVRIYNADGGLWCEYSLLDSHPLFYGHLGRKDFSPIFPIKFALFRLTGVSDYWYRVEVNTKTGAEKFVRRSDPFLKRVSIADAILRARGLKFNSRTNPIRREPEGTPVAFDWRKGGIIRAVAHSSENWIQVEVVQPKDGPVKFGWIKWKDKGNKLLISFALDSLPIFSEPAVSEEAPELSL